MAMTSTGRAATVTARAAPWWASRATMATAITAPMSSSGVSPTRNSHQNRPKADA